MTYKIFYNSGSDSDFFNSCRPVAGAPLSQIYRCCMATCKESEICPALCTNVYQGTIVEDCSAAIGCWENAGYFNQDCLAKNSAAIHDCCINRCRNGAFSAFSEFKNRNIDIHNIDCNEYCNDYQVIDG